MNYKQAKSKCKMDTLRTHQVHSVIKCKEWKLANLMAGGSGYTGNDIYCVILNTK